MIFRRLKDLACPGVGILAVASRSELQCDLEGHLKFLLRQGDLVLETTWEKWGSNSSEGKDRIKQFGGKHTPATSGACMG